MKSSSENTLAPLPSPESRIAKVLLFAPGFASGQTILHELKAAGDLFVETFDDPDQLVHEIARTTPHLLLAYARPDSDTGRAITGHVRLLFPDLHICLVTGDLSENLWQPGLRELLAKPVPPETPRPYADGSRIVFHDESLHSFWKGKLNRPQREEGWEKICSHQEARFVMQLQTARKHHHAAKKYYLCLLAQQSGLDEELAYRLAHGSYKALSWGRDLAVKWLALLAHYLPDTQLEHLPKAGTPGPKIDFVHHDMPMEGVYAATLLILYKIKPALAEMIKQLVTARFDGQTDDELLALSLQLYGTAKFLQQVGTAQIELMDAWLDPSIVDRADDTGIPRGEHRNAGIFRDFYDLGFIVNSPEPLNSILKGFHAGTTYVQQERFLPSFTEFRRLIVTREGS